MACDLETLQTNACASGIGKLDGEVQLLQVIAQASAETLVALSPGTEITLAAIHQRACEIEMGKLDSHIVLLQIIAQNLCTQIT